MAIGLQMKLECSSRPPLLSSHSLSFARALKCLRMQSDSSSRIARNPMPSSASSSFDPRATPKERSSSAQQAWKRKEGHRSRACKSLALRYLSRCLLVSSEPLQEPPRPLLVQLQHAPEEPDLLLVDLGRHELLHVREVVDEELEGVAAVELVALHVPQRRRVPPAHILLARQHRHHPLPPRLHPQNFERRGDAEHEEEGAGSSEPGDEGAVGEAVFVLLDAVEPEGGEHVQDRDLRLLPEPARQVPQ
eukprot:766244-Hanusia_phi.AAC.6